MSTCRKTHNTDSIRIYFPSFCILPDKIYASLHIQKHIGISVAARQQAVMRNECRYTTDSVFKDKSRNTLRLQPLGYAVPLGFTVKPKIASSRTYYDGRITIALSDIRCQLYIGLIIGAFPDVNCCLSIYPDNGKQRDDD